MNVMGRQQRVGRPFVISEVSKSERLSLQRLIRAGVRQAFSTLELTKPTPPSDHSLVSGLWLGGGLG